MLRNSGVSGAKEPLEFTVVEGLLQERPFAHLETRDIPRDNTSYLTSGMRDRISVASRHQILQTAVGDLV